MNRATVSVLFLIFLSCSPGVIDCCISDPSVLVLYDITVDMDMLTSLKVEGFSFELVYDVIPAFGAQGRREFALYKGHYGLSSVLVAADVLVIQAHEEQFQWDTGITTELLFLQTLHLIDESLDIDTIAQVAAWESTSGTNIFAVPPEVEFISVSTETYSASIPLTTDYFNFIHGWIAVPGNATISVNDTILSVVIMRCGGELSTDTRRIPVFAPFRGVVLVCNSIDYDLTGKVMESLLEDLHIPIITISPREFQYYRWFSPRIILLGGHQAPEGMGDIVATILTEPEKQMIEKTGPYMFSADDLDFRNQSIIVLAGADREGTNSIALTRIDDIVLWVQSL
ncbi:MAG: hypothetical protein HXS47_12645 [Theionarchaea archaeon]|nr:hypothetical protein [Theionarchaea archaeon]